MPPKQKKRGAATPRSSFRKPAANKKKAKPVAKTAAKKKPTAKKKPAANKQPANKQPPAKPAATNPVAKPVKRPIPTANRVLLGEITVPSGKLAIFDVGLVGYLPREALEPAIVKATVPADRPLRVVGAPVGKGRFSDCWDHVAIELAPGEVQFSKKLGEAGVDFARLICMDHAALDHWQHEDSLDGKADFIFWGRDEAQLARAMRAKKASEGYGWTDLTIEEAEKKADEAARLKSDNRWLFAADYRPHTHHYYVLAKARSNPRGAGTLELAGTQLLLFFTSWGDGVFPIYLDFDADEHPVQVRIQLATADSNAAMSAVNP